LTVTCDTCQGGLSLVNSDCPICVTEEPGNNDLCSLCETGFIINWRTLTCILEADCEANEETEVDTKTDLCIPKCADNQFFD